MLTDLACCTSLGTCATLARRTITQSPYSPNNDVPLKTVKESPVLQREGFTENNFEAGGNPVPTMEGRSRSLTLQIQWKFNVLFLKPQSGRLRSRSGSAPRAPCGVTLTTRTHRFSLATRSSTICDCNTSQTLSLCILLPRLQDRISPFSRCLEAARSFKLPCVCCKFIVWGPARVRNKCRSSCHIHFSWSLRQSVSASTFVA